MSFKESTYARYKRLVDTHISPMLGKYDITKISTQLIEQYIDFLLTSGRLDGQGGLSPKTVSDIITIIKSTMEYAKYHGYNVNCHIGKLSLKNKEYIEMRVLTSLEQNALLHVLFENIVRGQLKSPKGVTKNSPKKVMRNSQRLRKHKNA